MKKLRFKITKPRFLIYFFSTIVFPIIIEKVYEDDADTNRLISYIKLTLFLLFLSIVIELILYLLQNSSIVTTKNALFEISKIGKKYTLPQGSPMFYVDENDYAILTSLYNNQSKLFQYVNSKITVYHSTTAKKHLSWVEFVFWHFLAQVKKKIGCKIMISLHFDEQCRENGIDTNDEIDRFNELFDAYSNIAKAIISKDIDIIKENDFHKQDADLYASTFHNLFIQRIIGYAKEISSGTIDMKGFMRRLSYLESVFPIIALTKRSKKKGRIIILDRVHAHGVWSKSPLKEYKDSLYLLFITAQTLVDQDGKPIRIFKPDDNVNITDSISDIRNKLSLLDFKVKNDMYTLLKSTISNETKVVTEKEINDEIIQLIEKIKHTYNL